MNLGKFFKEFFVNYFSKSFPSRDVRSCWIHFSGISWTDDYVSKMAEYENVERRIP